MRSNIRVSYRRNDLWVVDANIALAVIALANIALAVIALANIALAVIALAIVALSFAIIALAIAFHAAYHGNNQFARVLRPCGRPMQGVEHVVQH